MTAFHAAGTVPPARAAAPWARRAGVIRLAGLLPVMVLPPVVSVVEAGW